MTFDSTPFLSRRVIAQTLIRRVDFIAKKEPTTTLNRKCERNNFLSFTPQMNSSLGIKRETISERRRKIIITKAAATKLREEKNVNKKKKKSKYPSA